MAGFFGMFNFDKPGRGVGKDAPRKKGFFLFFEIFLRKFWRICSLSLFVSFFAIPAAVVYFYLAIFLLGMLAPISDPQAIVWLSVYIAIFLTCFLGAGPVGAGQAYVLRNFARETHAWVWEDFWGKMCENFWKGLLFFFLDLILLVVLVFAAVLYFTNGSAMPLPPILTMAFGFFALFALLVYFMMHFFLYPLMVTLDLKTGKLFKTALQLTMLKLPACVLIFALSIAMFSLFFYLMMINIALIVGFAVLGFSAVAFVYTFYSTSVIDKILDGR